MVAKEPPPFSRAFRESATARGLLVEEALAFGDLLWGVGSLEEVAALDKALIITSTESRGLVALQAIHSELRYYATEDRSLDSPDHSAREIGILHSETDALDLCEKLLLMRWPLKSIKVARRRPEF